MTVVKFRISSYFAQITSIVSCFGNYPSKVLKRSSFFEIEESSKMAILAASRRRKWPKIVHFLFARTDQGDDIYQYGCQSFRLQVVSPTLKLKIFCEDRWDRSRIIVQIDLLLI